MCQAWRDVHTVNKEIVQDHPESIHPPLTTSDLASSPDFGISRRQKTNLKTVTALRPLLYGPVSDTAEVRRRRRQSPSPRMPVSGRLGTTKRKAKEGEAGPQIAVIIMTKYNMERQRGGERDIQPSAPAWPLLKPRRTRLRMRTGLNATKSRVQRRGGGGGGWGGEDLMKGLAKTAFSRARTRGGEAVALSVT
ncbi:hypothetical protein DPEC_G00349270 [Dallia pectoralis]|uniref:Uncharacterized protein n=1 Tax=Dallia pectoralis TaxID=75939 RepID=A0ACC2F1D8_DALPE|nr:hypothetical protein DPEC_G00349270 [Dallia pectoralis]